MKFQLNCKFLSKEMKMSKKGNSYLVVTVMEGIDTLTLMSDIDINAEFGKDFIAIIDYDIKYKNLRLVGAK